MSSKLATRPAVPVLVPRPVTPPIARTLLWELGDYTWGCPPDHFESSLFLLYRLADTDRQSRLEDAFPEYLGSLAFGRRDPNRALVWLRGIVTKGESPRV